MVYPNHIGLFPTAELETKEIEDIGLAIGLIPKYCILLKKYSKVQVEYGLIYGLREQIQ